MFWIGFERIHSETSYKETRLSIFKPSVVNPVEFAKEQIKIQKI